MEAFADPSSGAAPLRVNFTATGLDPDNGPLTYRWTFADGTALGASVTARSPSRASTPRRSR